MKRFLAATAVTVCLGASAVYAHSALTIRPSDMKDGETKVLTDDDRKITVKREGDKLRVEIDKAGATDKLTIVRDGESVRIERGDGTNAFIYGPGSDGFRRRIVIDGTPLDLDRPHLRERSRDGAAPGERHLIEPFFDRLPRGEAVPHERMQSWFVCPKDRTVLRVPEDAQDKEYKCPVDGTVMEQRRARTFFFESLKDGHDS